MTVVRIAGLLHGVLCGVLLASAQPTRTDEFTVLDLGDLGNIRLPGQFTVTRHDSLLGHFITYMTSDSTRMTVNKSWRKDYKLSSDSLPPGQWIAEFYDEMASYVNGLGHRGNWPTMSKVEDCCEKNWIVWQVVDRSETKELGLYGADKEFVYRLSITSPLWTENEQQLCLLSVFRDNIHDSVLVPCGLAR